jgi:hypothetical protein
MWEAVHQEKRARMLEAVHREKRVRMLGEVPQVRMARRQRVYHLRRRGQNAAEARSVTAAQIPEEVPPATTEQMASPGVDLPERMGRKTYSAGVYQVTLAQSLQVGGQEMSV